MSQIKFEQNVRPEETVLQLRLKALVTEFTGEDCREMRSEVKRLVDEFPGKSGFAIGCGGSHIWIHRRESHVEGNPISSDRWAIITD